MLLVLEWVAVIVGLGSTVWSIFRAGDWLPEVFIGLAFAVVSIIEFMSDGAGFFFWFTIVVTVLGFWFAYVKFRDAAEDSLDA